MRAVWALRSALFVVFLIVTVMPWAVAVLLLSIAWRGPRLYWAAVGWLAAQSRLSFA
jgi:1-acyl-sn-glycerol-3-phosphate acyltransferase